MPHISGSTDYEAIWCANNQNLKPNNILEEINKRLHSL